MGYTLRDLITGMTLPNGKAIIDHLTKSAGIAMTMQIIEANRGTFHLFEKALGLPTGTIRLIGGSITPSSIKSIIGQADLQEFGIVQDPDASLVEQLGGGNSPAQVMAYFLDKYPSVLEGMLQTISTQVIYGTDPTFGNDQGFKGLHQYAKASSNVRQAGGATGHNTTIFVVRWNPEFCSAVLNPAVMGRNEAFMRSSIPVHNLKVTNVSTSARQPVYDVLNQSSLGLMVATDECVAAITQLDSTHKPSVTYMAEALRRVHARRDLKGTMIYCSEQGADWLDELTNAKLELTPKDRDYKFVMEAFNNVDRVIDENISDVETSVLD